MATTTNYGWTTPNDTDLVKDGAAAIRTLGSSVDTTTKNLNPETTLGDMSFRSATSNVNTRLPIGSSGQHLTVVAGVPAWATASDQTPLTTKGDLFTFSTVDARLGVGTNDHRLVAASGEATGLKYVADTQNTVIDAEGDLLVGDAADALQRLAIGSNAQVLTVDTTVDGKIKWATPAAGSTFVGVQVTKTANTSVGSGANVQIPWDSEAFDTNAFHDNSTNNARLTVPSGQGGYYTVYFAMQWASSATVARRIVAIYKNGNSSTGTFINNFETSSINFPSCAMSFTINLAAADWLEIDAYQGTAGALDFRSSNAIFGMEKIG
jgi:hypothetical protein